MDAQPQAAGDAAQVGGAAYVRNLAAAEAAVLRGQFNLAKVLRAFAHAQRTQAVAAARGQAEAVDGAAVLGAIQQELALVDSSGPVRQRLEALLTRATESLTHHSDIQETDVDQFLWGCYGCGFIAEGRRPEACPACGALATEFELFAPFYSASPEHLGRLTPSQVLSILQETPDAVAAAIMGLDEPRLRQRPSPHEWSIVETIGHMLETDRLFVAWAQRMLAESGVPSIAMPTPPWKLHEGKGYEGMAIDELLSHLRAARQESLTLVRELDPKQWARRAVIQGPLVSLVDLGTWLANHDRGHLAQLRRQSQTAA